MTLDDVIVVGDTPYDAEVAGGEPAHVIGVGGFLKKTYARVALPSTKI